MAALPMCPGCRAILEPGPAVCPYCGWELARTESRRKGGLVERALSRVGGVVPALLFANAILAVAVVAVHVQVGKRHADRPPDAVGLAVDGVLHPSGRVLLDLGANVPELVLRGDWWRLLCPVFLHGGLLHIIFNMWSLRSIGGVVEEAFGTGKALALYLLAGLAGNLASVGWVAFHGSVTDGIGREVLIPRIGASGAILGLAGLLAALGFRIGGPHGKALWSPMVKSVGFILVLGLVLSFSKGGFQFDNTAHLGGFLFGLAAGFLCSFGIRARGNPAAVRAWDAAAVVLSALTVASFVPPALAVAGALR